MPPYLVLPNDVRPSLLFGKPGFSFGSFDSHNPGARMQVTSVALASDVATVGVTLLEGTVPIVGQLVTLQGTQTDSGAFNVKNVAIASVTGFTTAPLFNAGTITFALVQSGTITTTADAGSAIAPAPEVAETLAASTAYKQYVVSRLNEDSSGRTVTWETDFTNCAGAEQASDVIVNLQGSLTDVDGDYATLDTTTNIAGETRFLNGVTMPFLRLQTGSITGTAKGTGKILV